jgi:hypothetical protein
MSSKKKEKKYVEWEEKKKRNDLHLCITLVLNIAEGDRTKKRRNNFLR